MTMRRFMWTAVFIGSLGLLVVECAERVAFYFSYPHVAKLEEVATNNLVFPAVTICNLNEFRFSKLTVNDLYHAGELLGLLNVHLEIQSPQMADPIVLKALKEKADFTHYKPRVFNMREFYDRVGHSLKDMMLYCKFRGVRCTHKDFKTVSWKWYKRDYCEKIVNWGHAHWASGYRLFLAMSIAVPHCGP
eukprot:g47751.t1